VPQESVFEGLPTPTTLPDLDDDGVYSCSVYELFAQKDILGKGDYLGMLACERYLRDPRITVVDFAEQSDEQLQTYTDILDARSRAVDLLDEPTFTIVPATKEMQQAYRDSRTEACDVYEKDKDSDIDPAPTVSDIAKQFVPQKSYDRLIALTGRHACKADDGMGVAGTAAAGRIDLYGVDLSTVASMTETTEVSLHELGHTQLGHSGYLSINQDPVLQLRSMNGGTYDLSGAMADNSSTLKQYGGDGIMSGQRSAPDLNPVQRYELQWPERALGKQDNRLVDLHSASATFTQESTPEDLAMVEFAEPVMLPDDDSHAETQEQKDYIKSQPQPSVDELYFVANKSCADQPNSTAPTMVTIYARDSFSGDVAYLVSPAPMLDEPETAADNEFDYGDYDLCLPSAELIKQDYAANLHLGDDRYVTLSYDGESNEVSISKVFTQSRPGKSTAE
jgi:hypothetical protein